MAWYFFAIIKVMLNNIQQNFKRFKIRHLLALIFLFVVALLAGFISQANQTFMNANFVKKYFSENPTYYTIKVSQAKSAIIDRFYGTGTQEFTSTMNSEIINFAQNLPDNQIMPGEVMYNLQTLQNNFPKILGQLILPEEYQKYQNLIIDNIYQIPSNINLEQTLMNNFSAKIDHFLAESGQSINPAVLNATTHYIVQVYLSQLTMRDTIHEIKQNFTITKKYMDILTLIILISLLALIVLNYFLYDLMGWRIFIFTTTLMLFLAGYLASMPICQQMIQQIFVIK